LDVGLFRDGKLSPLNYRTKLCSSYCMSLRMYAEHYNTVEGRRQHADG